MVNDRWKMSQVNLYQIRVKNVNDDVISGLVHPLAAEIVFTSFSTRRKAFIKLKR